MSEIFFSVIQKILPPGIEIYNDFFTEYFVGCKNRIFEIILNFTLSQGLLSTFEIMNKKKHDKEFSLDFFFNL